MECMTSSFPANDAEFEEYVIDRVDEKGGTMDLRDGASFLWKREGSNILPRVGQTARMYGRGFGYIVRGLFIDGQCIYYLTAEEQHAKDKGEAVEHRERQEEEYAAGKSEFDARIAVLPEVFRERIEAFRERRDDFGPRFEAYELFCCEQAVALATWALDQFPQVPQDDRTEEKRAGLAEATIDIWNALDYELQRSQFPGLSDEHSGNTHGAMVVLAKVYLTEPELVPQMHGALCPLVGCAGYGCWSTTQPVIPCPEEPSHAT